MNLNGSGFKKKIEEKKYIPSTQIWVKVFSAGAKNNPKTQACVDRTRVLTLESLWNIVLTVRSH